jgi:hypothetical protein
MKLHASKGTGKAAETANADRICGVIHLRRGQAPANGGMLVEADNPSLSPRYVSRRKSAWDYGLGQAREVDSSTFCMLKWQEQFHLLTLSLLPARPVGFLPFGTTAIDR